MPFRRAVQLPWRRLRFSLSLSKVLCCPAIPSFHLPTLRADPKRPQSQLKRARYAQQRQGLADVADVSKARPEFGLGEMKTAMEKSGVAGSPRIQLPLQRNV